MLIDKEQTLERNLGAPSDGLYRAYSASANPSSGWVDVGDYPAAYREYFDSMEKRATVLYYPSYLGVQRFRSTTRPKPLYNECSNLKTRLTAYPFGMWYRDYRNSNTMYKDPFWRIGLPSGSASVSPPDKVDWSESQFASNRAWATMQPRFEGDFQALNFLYELKDFKNIAKSISALRPTQIVDTLKRARAKIRAARRAVESGSTSSRLQSIASCSTRTAAEVTLIKHFAIDPTVKDLVALHDQLATSVRDAQHRFRDSGLAGSSRHYSEKISETDGTTVGTKNSYWYRKGIYKKDTFTATMSFSFDYEMRDTMDAFSRLYGFGMNAGVAWNAIPFSFLVDYFVKVGDAIESMQQDPNVHLDLHQYCESRLVEIRNGAMFAANGKIHCAIVNGTIPSDYDLITGYEGSYFERRVVSPSKGIVLPKVKLPSVKQAVNIAALVRCMW